MPTLGVYTRAMTLTSVSRNFTQEVMTVGLADVLPGSLWPHLEVLTFRELRGSYTIYGEKDFFSLSRFPRERTDVDREVTEPSCFSKT